MAVLNRRQFGDPLLRETARRMTKSEILSEPIKHLIADMRQTLRTNELGVGLAAPQVGESVALSVIWIEPTAQRPHVENFSATIINPKIVSSHGRRVQRWEGCISGGSHGTADLFAKVPRYNDVDVEYLDEKGNQHTETYTGLLAQIMQHEIDHLNGILFVDRVKDTKTYMTHAEYRKMLKEAS